MWNRHVRKYRIYADSNVPRACELFSRLHGSTLIERGLRHNYLLHLCNLWDNALLTADVMQRCMAIVDEPRPAPPPSPVADMPPPQ